MAGITDVVFRALAKKYGAGMTCTEFVSSTGIVRGNEKTLQMLRVDPIEKPVAVQLFGNSVDDVVNAALQIEEKFDIIDVNCGCPAWKVIKTGAGSEMLKQPEKIGMFVRKLVDAVSKPVTVKIRIGVSENEINAVKVAKIIEDAGAAAIAVHGRTQQQGYSGSANWDIIKDVKGAVGIPVIGNGEVFTPEIFVKRLEESGVDAILIARGAVGNPYFFKQIMDYMKKGEYGDKPVFDMYENYVEIAEKYEIPLSIIRNHALYFVKGINNGAKIRDQIGRCKSIVELSNVFEKIKEREIMQLQQVLSQ